MKGWKYALENPEFTVDLLAKYNPKIDKNQQLKAMKILKEYVYTEDSLKYGFGWMDKEKWMAVQNVLIDQKIIEKPVPIEELFTNQFLENSNMKNN